jgi:hypothetical protein
LLLHRSAAAAALPTMPTTLESTWEVYEALNFYRAFGVGAAPQQNLDQAAFSQVCSVWVALRFSPA